MMDNQEQQENECLALESILGESCFHYSDGSGWMKVEMNLPQSPLDVIIAADIDASNELSSSTSSPTLPLSNNKHRIDFLPPITLSFTFNEDYPSSKAPAYIMLSNWMSASQMHQLCNELDQLWEKECGNEILYLWYEYLQNDALPSTLGISDVLQLNQVSRSKMKLTPQQKQRVVPQTTNRAEILPLLLVHNEERKQAEFDKSMFDCLICLSEKAGTNCTKFTGCDHVYCKTCMTSYFEVNIKDGNVAELSCPDPDCKSTPIPQQIKKLVSEDIYTRYDKLLLQVGLDTMTDIMYCPLKHCQSAVIIDQGEKVGQCPNCSFAFCIYCNHPYHGVSPCKILSGARKEILETYPTANAATKAKLEKKWGRKQILEMVADHHNQSWLKENSKPCPKCRSPVEKNSGCNHMKCTKCRTDWCWLCGDKLPANDPYKHFSSSTTCNNRLFEGIDVDDDEFFEDDFEDDIAFFLRIDDDFSDESDF